MLFWYFYPKFISLFPNFKFLYIETGPYGPALALLMLASFTTTIGEFDKLPRHRGLLVHLLDK